MPQNFVEVNGLVLPGNCKAYAPGHDVAATARFLDYGFSRSLDQSPWMPVEAEWIGRDTSSCCNRQVE